ncbi:dienelactone hydrolase family protein [Reyranella sp.]|uniref:dienelactone hydrolase family protein n=1 Tax=Reyranella sp. TaxID=1929291 RepID=UPI0025F213EF|nr:dienelactone hydrolase family protein [Reyranella sp.]
MPSAGSFLGALVALIATAASCFAGTQVEIPAAEPDQKPLPAYLARPSGAGPFPAVVVLHGCGGFGYRPVSWADLLASWGYVALAIDSLTPRGKTTACSTGLGEQPVDAYQALKYLAAQPFVRADRVGVLGMSMGGWSVLFALQRDMLEPKYTQKFRAGVALYPQCRGMSGLMTAPTLILIGELDDWTPAAACRAMVAGEAESGTYAPPYGKRESGDRSMLELVVYPDTYHSFDAANLRFGDGMRFLGHFLQYNDAATRDSVERVRTFLGRTLAD